MFVVKMSMRLFLFPAFLSCSKLEIIGDIARGTIITNPDAASCPEGGNGSPEAFILGHCQPLQNKTPGIQV